MPISTKQFVKAYTPRKVDLTTPVLGAARLLEQRRSNEARESLSAERNRISAGKSTGKNKMLDMAIKVHNKKLDFISKENKRRADLGESPLAMPRFSDTLRDEFGVASVPTQPAAPASSAMLSGGQQQPQNPLLNVMRNSAIQNIPASNRGPMAQPNIDRAQLAQIVNSVPTPKNMVHPMLPKMAELIMALEDYDNPKDAIQELMQLDDDLLAQGLDLASYGDDTEEFFEAFRNKFGDAALQTLQEDIGSKRGAGY